MKNFFLLFILIVSTGCVTTSTRNDALESSPETKQRFFVLKQKLSFATASPETINEIRSIIINNKNTDIASEAAFALGNYYQKNKEPEKALSYYENVLNSNVHSNLDGKSLAEASKIYFQKGDLSSALTMTTRGLKLFKLSREEKLKIHKVQYNIFEQNKDVQKQILSLSRLVELENDSSKKRFGEEKAMALVDQLSFSQKKALVSNRRVVNLARSRAAFLLGQEQMGMQKNRSATVMFQEATKLAPEASWNTKAVKSVSLIEQVSEVNPKVVGVILPITGKHAIYGKKALDGIRLGSAGSDIELKVIDSMGIPEQALKAVDELVFQHKAIAIIGSLMSKTALPVSRRANELGIPNISLSQKNDLPNVGDYIFKNALSYKSQVRAILDVATKKHGFKKFGILFPNDPYGVGMSNAFWDEANKRDLSIVAAERYSSDSKSYTKSIKRLVGTYFVGAREDEYKEKLSKWYNEQKSINIRTVPPDDILSPIVEFDALFIPDSTKALGQLAPMLAYENVRGIKLMGTSLWNTSHLITRSQGLAEKSIFADTHLQNSSSYKSTDFYNTFSAKYQRSPGVFDILGYDTGLILKQLLITGSKSRNSLRDSIASLNNFPGAVGKLSVLRNGEILRPMVALTVDGGKIIEHQ